MEVNENRGRLGRKNFRRKSVKRGNRLKEKNFTGSVKRANPRQRKYACFQSDGTCSAGWQQAFFPVCPAVCGRLFHSWGRLTHSAFTFRFRQKEQRKKKNHLKPRKSTSWHRRKKKEAQHHQSKHRLGVRLCLFLRLCGSRHTFAQTRFGQWCSDGQNRFYGKIL